LKIEKLQNHWKHWTPEEDEFLRRSYSSLSKEELIQKLKKHWTAIQHRASTLGLNRRGRKDHLKLDELTEWEKGYIAGIIDGEGSISIEKMSRGLLLPRIKIVNTNRSILEFCQSIIGGTIVRRKRFGNRKDSYEQRLPSNKDYLKWLINQIQDSLVGKREQLLIVKKFLESRENTLKGKRLNQAHYTAEELKLVEEIKKLNVRGVTNAY
jgi:hypothetical protein